MVWRLKLPASRLFTQPFVQADQRKHQGYAPLAFEGESQVTGEFPAQRARNMENVSIWWRHHVYFASNKNYSVLLDGFPRQLRYPKGGDKMHSVYFN